MVIAGRAKVHESKLQATQHKGHSLWSLKNSEVVSAEVPVKQEAAVPSPIEAHDQVEQQPQLARHVEQEAPLPGSIGQDAEMQSPMPAAVGEALEAPARKELPPLPPYQDGFEIPARASTRVRLLPLQKPNVPLTEHPHVSPYPFQSIISIARLQTT
jgi:hypothetical protein